VCAAWQRVQAHWVHGDVDATLAIMMGRRRPGASGPNVESDYAVTTVTGMRSAPLFAASVGCRPLLPCSESRSGRPTCFLSLLVSNPLCSVPTRLRTEVVELQSFKLERLGNLSHGFN
jgi:hypothetical protein